MPGVALVLGNQEKFRIVERIREIVCCRNEKEHETQDAGVFIPACSLFDRTRSFLKVQDGCDYRCSYCTIPKVRGSSRNAPVADIVAQARDIAAQGIREVVLTGVNIGDFGRSTGEDFLQLLTALDAVDGLERIRTGSLEPNLITEAIIELTARSAKIAPHFHMPLQSGCNRILALMARRYRRELFAGKAALIRQHIPHAAIGADVIAGFPGETDEDFADTVAFIEGLDLSYLHVFVYSERPGTKAAEMPGKVPSCIAEQRSRTLIDLSNGKRQEFYRKHIGETVGVLFEHKEKGGVMTGFTGNYIRAQAPYDSALVGRCVPVTVTGVNAAGNAVNVVPCRG
jgi:threonylcarbamoyladenosine tRNA methylthiotransferase MtaB